MCHHFIAYLGGYVVSPRKKSSVSQYAFLCWRPCFQIMGSGKAEFLNVIANAEFF